MKRFILFIFLLLVIGSALHANAATTWNITSIQTTSAIQSVITGASAGDTVSFAAGTYNITAGLNLKCGITYTGPGATPSTAILNATFTRESASIFNLSSGSGFANPCTTPTTIQYLKFENAGGINVQTSFTNLTIQFNQFTNIPCCNGGAPDTAIFFNGGSASSNTAQNLTNTVVQWNTIGDSTSCTTPTNGMTDVSNSPELGAVCGGMSVNSTVGFGTNGTSTFGLKFLNNQVFHVGEGVYWGCPNPPGSNSHGPCEPNTGGYESAGSGVETRWVTATGNDFNQIHAAAWEEQPQVTQGIVFTNNSEHDWFDAYFHSYGQSMACCVGEGVAPALSPYLNDSNNVVLFNAAPSGTNYAYGSEAWGLNATYNNNLYQGLNASSHQTAGIVFGYGPLATINNNTVCGSAFNQASIGYIGSEGLSGQPGPPPMSGNITGPAPCSAVTSVAPVISPAAGTQNYPLTVTMTDAGLTSGAQPLGNHSIYYTVDGSTPTVSSALYTGPITLIGPATVKALGMWGTGANVTAYPSGYGFVPSSVITNNYTASTAVSCGTLATNPTQTTIQSALTACGNSGGGVVTFIAGTSTINSSMTLPCGVSLQGPLTNPGYQTRGDSVVLVYPTTAILSASGRTYPIFTFGSCTKATTISGLQFQNTSALYGNGPINNFTFTKNACYNLPGGEGNNGSCAYFNACNNCNTTSVTGLPIGPNVQFTWNDVGDANSCLTPTNVMQYAQTDQGGLCNGFMEHGQVNGLTISNNSFYHLENGANKIVCAGGGSSSCEPSANQPNMQNVVILNNNMDSIHRIVVEEQPQPSQGNILNQYNSIGNPLNPNNLSLGISMPCCDTGAVSPGEITSDNVFWNASTQSNQQPFAIEWWGLNAQASNNLFQGEMDCGIGWGYPGGTGMVASYNTIQLTGAVNAYVCNEEGQPSPTITATNGSTTATQQTSAAPSISPASGAVTFPLVVTLTDAGYAQPTPLPRGNTSIWYTTDGTAPVPNSGTSKLYTAPFTLAAAATVNAVGMWGTGANTISYPSPYGFKPSAVVSAVFTGTSTPTQFYISPTGSDSNNGTSTSTPWLSPNHAMTCGQVITALPGTYSSANFYNGKWGTVSCPAGNNVAWLTCQTFDTCKISATSQQGMYVSASYWGISGWEISDTWTFGNCYYIQPTGATSVHHVIFANDIANGCAGGGFVAFANAATPAVDYIALIGDIAYNTGSSSSVCASGFSLGFLPQLDSVAGTHLYIAGSFGWKNTNPSSCASTAATDGEGIIIDTLKQYNYNQQVALENNIMVGNYGRGIEMNNNNTATPATFFTKNNTLYGNNTQAGQQFPNFLGEEYINQAYSVNSTADLAMTSTGTIGGIPIYAYSAEGTNGSSTVAGNWLYSAAGNTTLITSSSGFSFGSNVTGTNPAFVNPVIPGAPSCSGTANVPACAATLVANFVPTVTAAKAYGYQTPSSTPVSDPLYPQWLCTVTLPAGLVTPGCASSATLQSGFQSNAANLNTLTVSQSGVQQTAVGQYSDGSMHNLPFNGQSPSWSSSNSGILNVTSTGLVSCVATGSANSLVSATPSGIHFNIYTWTCVNPTLTGVTVACSGGATTVSVGSSLTCIATCSYSGGLAATNCSTTDSHGTDANFVSSNTAAATVNASGTLSGIAAGSTNLTATAGSFTSSPVTVTVTAPTPVLQSVTLNLGGATALNVGQTLQAAAQCNYSGGIITTCSPGPDTYGTTASGWASSNTSVATISGSGLITAVANGIATFTVGANTFTSPGVPISVSSSPPAATLTGVTVTGPNTVVNGNVLTLGAQCSYSDGSTTSCQTTDAHGNVAGSWSSSNTSAATIDSTTGVVTSVAPGVTVITATAGGFTSPNFTVTITTSPTVSLCGPNQSNVATGRTSANFVNATYCVTGSNSGGYNSTQGSFFLPAGTQISGANWDLLVTPAPTGTTQASAPICKGTYTSSGTTSPNAWISVTLGTVTSPTTACHLAPSTGYWIGLVTNSGTNVPQGFYNCGSSCAGALPTSGQNAGSYHYYFGSQVYGTYSGNGTTLSPGSAVQSSQYITMVVPAPALTGGFQQSNPLNVNTINVGGTLQLTVFCQYSDGSTNQCFPTPDVYGNTVTACTASNPSVLDITSISGTTPCLISGISGGTAFSDVTLTGGVAATPYSVTSQSFLTHPVPGSPRQLKR